MVDGQARASGDMDTSKAKIELVSKEKAAYEKILEGYLELAAISENGGGQALRLQIQVIEQCLATTTAFLDVLQLEARYNRL